MPQAPTIVVMHLPPTQLVSLHEVVPSGQISHGAS
jgi:hypothetical protein